MTLLFQLFELHFVSNSKIYFQEITVIFADPEDPPYSLLTLPILWPGVSWNISYHIHSSITKDIKELKDINAFKNILCHGNNKTVRVVVIWQPSKLEKNKIIIELLIYFYFQPILALKL